MNQHPTPFDQLLDSLPTQERESLLKICRQLSINDNHDPMFKILLALEYYRKLYGEIPAKIINATEQAKAATLASIQKDIEQAHDKAITKMAEKVSNKAIELAKLSKITTVLLTVIICTIIITIALYFSAQWMEKQNSIYTQSIEKQFQEQYLAKYNQWIAETTRNIEILKSHPKIQQFAIDNIDKIQWLKTSQGKTMWDIHNFYSGPSNNSNAPYPCLKHSSESWTRGNKPITVCEVALGYQ